MSTQQTTKKRLEGGFQILQAIRRRRDETGSPMLGWAIERAIVDKELRELEMNWVRDGVLSTCRPLQFPPDLRLGGRVLKLRVVR